MSNPKTAPQYVKIIAGQWRGKKLPVLLKDGVRPTPNRIRETLFNWLQFSIEGSHCLDLFAGSGALGFEAKSRGAYSVVFVDNDPEIISTIAEQTKSLGAEHTEVQRMNGLQYLEQTPKKFDVIFIDPPFARFNLEEIANKISQNEILKENAVIYMEGPRGDLPKYLPSNWQWQRQSKAGDVEYGLIQTSI